MLTANASYSKKILKALQSHGSDFEETNQLRNQIKSKLKKRKYLTADEVDQIIKWKLDSQYHRSKQQRSINTDSVVIPITQACFIISNTDFEYETELKLKVLTALKGIAIPLASAILAITEPSKYAVIDSVLWSHVYGEEKNSFSARDYLRFIYFVKKLSLLTKLDVQKTEFGMWLHATKSIE